MAGGALTLRDALLPAIDAIRGIPAQLGLRLYTVAITARTWTGARPGIGTSSDVTTGIKIDLGIYQTKVTQITERDIIASGGLYNDQDLRVGPITPPFAGSTADNSAISVFDPPVGAAPVELFFLITGPNMPAGGAYFKRIGVDVSKSFRYMFTIRKTGETP